MRNTLLFLTFLSVLPGSVFGQWHTETMEIFDREIDTVVIHGEKSGAREIEMSITCYQRQFVRGKDYKPGDSLQSTWVKLDTAENSYGEETVTWKFLNDSVVKEINNDGTFYGVIRSNSILRYDFQKKALFEVGKTIEKDSAGFIVRDWYWKRNVHDTVRLIERQIVASNGDMVAIYSYRYLPAIHYTSFEYFGDSFFSKKTYWINYPDSLRSVFLQSKNDGTITKRDTVYYAPVKDSIALLSETCLRTTMSKDGKTRIDSVTTRDYDFHNDSLLHITSSVTITYYEFDQRGRLVHAAESEYGPSPAWKNEMIIIYKD